MGSPDGEGELPDVITDENGRYLIRDVTSLYLFVSAAPGSPYRFLCDRYPLFGGDRFSSELPLVHVTWAGDRLPPALTWIVGTSVWGRVVERHGDVLLPSAGATVTLDEGVWDPPAPTNASGFYMICSAVGGDQVRPISARKVGYRTSSRETFGGWEPEIHFELTPERSPPSLVGRAPQTRDIPDAEPRSLAVFCARQSDRGRGAKSRWRSAQACCRAALQEPHSDGRPQPARR